MNMVRKLLCVWRARGPCGGLDGLVGGGSSTYMWTKIPPILGERAHHRRTPKPPPGPPSRTGLDTGCDLSRGTTPQHSLSGLVLSSRHTGGFFLRVSAGGLDVVRKEAWPWCRTILGVRLCWELGEPKGPKGNTKTTASHPQRQLSAPHPPFTVASATPCRPRAALAAGRGPVALAKTGVSSLQVRI